MSTDIAVVLEGSHTGVFVVADVGGLVREAEGKGWHVVALDTSDVVDRDGYMTVVSEAFDLPEWFARSWDSLDDCLRVLDLDDPDGLLVVWDHWGAFAEADPVEFDAAVAVFQDVTVAWHDDETPGAVLLHGPGPETDLPALP
jgi:hypothetical protein